MSALIMAEAALGSFVPAEFGPAVRQMLIAFLRASRSDPLGQLDRAGEQRRVDPNLTADEIDRLDDASVLVAEMWRTVSGRSG